MGKMILIAAVANNKVIGMNGRIPWREDDSFRFQAAEDMDRFRKLTSGHAVLMGRNTYDSLVKPLKDRLNVVVTSRNDIASKPNLVTYYNLEDAIEVCRNYRDDGDFYVIGGGKIYSETMDLADRLQITHINKDYEGDCFFPNIDNRIWEKVESGPRTDYEFAVYERRK